MLFNFFLALNLFFVTHCDITDRPVPSKSTSTLTACGACGDSDHGEKPEKPDQSF